MPTLPCTTRSQASVPPVYVNLHFEECFRGGAEELIKAMKGDRNESYT
jgi:hypothetical protein